MNAARNLLQSLRDFGWPIFAYAIFAPLSTYLLPSSRSRQERTARLLFVGVILASTEALFFVGAESNNTVQVARLHPAWGTYVLLLTLFPLGAVGGWAVVRLREGRTTINIGRAAEAEHAPWAIGTWLYIAAVGIWLTCCIVAVVWLSRIVA